MRITLKICSGIDCDRFQSRTTTGTHRTLQFLVQNTILNAESLWKKHETTRTIYYFSRSMCSGARTAVRVVFWIPDRISTIMGALIHILKISKKVR